MGSKRAKGSRPKDTGGTLTEKSEVKEDGFPLLSLRHVRSGYGIEELSNDQRSEFLLKWAKRSQFTWAALNTQKKHGLGFEFLTGRQIKKVAPEDLSQAKYMIFRHQGNLPIVGFKVGDVFYVLWVEARYGDIYDH